MNIKKHIILIKKILFILLGVVIAIMGTIPYLIWKEELQRLPVMGYSGLLVSCITANATVFFPASGIIYVLTASTALNKWMCCLIGGIGTAIGEQVGYFCGKTGRQLLKETAFYERAFKWVKKHGFLTVFIFAMLPMPLFDIVGVTAGSCHMKWRTFTAACILGKIIKMLFMVIIICYLLPWVLDWLPFLPDSFIDKYKLFFAV